MSEKYFASDPEMFEWKEFDTEEEALNQAEEWIEDYYGNGKWAMGVLNIKVGKILWTVDNEHDLVEE